MAQPTALMRAVIWPTPFDYGHAWLVQRELHRLVRQGQAPPTLLLLEHPPTYTMGRRGGWHHLQTPAQSLAKVGYAFWHSDRGGDITYHGPGQLVGYPILPIAQWGLDVRTYVRLLENVLMESLRHFDIESHREDDFPGLWCGFNKIAAIGVRIAEGVSMHGFALNVAPNLKDFEHIIPCGLHGRGVTSMAQSAPDTATISTVAPLVASRLADALQCPCLFAEAKDLPSVSPEDLESLAREARWDPAQQHPG